LKKFVQRIFLYCFANIGCPRNQEEGSTVQNEVSKCCKGAGGFINFFKNAWRPFRALGYEKQKPAIDKVIVGSVTSKRVSTTSVCQVLGSNKHPHVFMMQKDPNKHAKNSIEAVIIHMVRGHSE